jgi:AcrR family transcriptional regulator
VVSGCAFGDTRPSVPRAPSVGRPKSDAATDAILHAALAVVVERGYAAASLDEIGAVDFIE